MRVAFDLLTVLHLKETSMSSMVKLSVDKGNFAGETYRFDAPMEFVVGRARDCDIQVPDTSDFRAISLHQHCT